MLNMPKCESSDSVALILGGHVNGYSIVNELYDSGIRDIALFDYGRSISRFSNKVKYVSRIDMNSKSLFNKLTELNDKYKKIIIFPTDDFHIEALYEIYADISSFCYIPFNDNNIIFSLDKNNQYKVCEEIGVPYPKSINVTNVDDLLEYGDMVFPMIIKPTTRKDLDTNVFRTLFIDNMEALEFNKPTIKSLLDDGITFILSEYIPGDDTNIYAYTCFRSQEGNILNEWSGKKLTQYPDNYGVVSSASHEADLIVEEQGRVLCDALDAFGIVEPEFKFDKRDNKYKLMEVNLRSMMWHRVGSISGFNLHETMYKYACGKSYIHYKQDKKRSAHFVLMLHELPNLIARKGYYQHFKRNVFGGESRKWAIFDSRDIKPFMFSLLILCKLLGGACLKRFIPK